MAEEPTDQQLREMAEHRGLKLVKSRKRKAGSGDFGKFGLTDAAGKALLGIGGDGLTATAQDIQAYLRTDAMDTWKQSANATPDAVPSKSRPAGKDETTDEQLVRRRHASPSRETPRRSRSPREQEAGARQERAAAEPGRMPRSGPRPVPVAPPPPEPETETETEPALRIRPAKLEDALEVMHLLNQLNGVALSREDVVRHLVQARKTKGGMLVAERKDLIGCCGWAVVPTIHRGAVGRLSALVVGEDHRRGGVGTALLAAADAILEKAGCLQMEAMSDIEIANAHNFFRSLDFNQASYRFVRRIGELPGRSRDEKSIG